MDWIGLVQQVIRLGFENWTHGQHSSVRKRAGLTPTILRATRGNCSEACVVKVVDENIIPTFFCGSSYSKALSGDDHHYDGSLNSSFEHYVVSRIISVTSLSISDEKIKSADKRGVMEFLNFDPP